MNRLLRITLITFLTTAGLSAYAINRTQLVSYAQSLKGKKKAELKTVEKDLGKLEEQKAAFDATQAEEAKKAELEETIQKLMADGVSAAEILEKLK